LTPEHLTELVRAFAAAADEEALALALAAACERAGASVELDYVVPGRPNVVATLRGGAGAGAPPLLLAGHLNPGMVTDMLGAWAAIVAALAAPARDIVVLATMAHDINATGVKYAVGGRTLPQQAIWGDPTGLAVLTAHGGAVRYEVRLTGRAAHVTRAEEGLDALAAAVRMTGALRFTHEPCAALPTLPRHVLGRLEAGAAPGVVAEHALLAGDVRTVPGMTPGTVRDDLERALPAGVRADVRITAHQRPFVAPPGRLAARVAHAHEAATGAPPPAPEPATHAYCTAAADLAAAGIETVVYGPGAFRLGQDAIDTAELVTAARVYAALVQSKEEVPCAPS
jgi:acetylornithine deacetylase